MKLTKEQQKELLWLDYEEFTEKFSDYLDETNDVMDLTNFLLYKILDKLDNGKKRT